MMSGKACWIPNTRTFGKGERPRRRPSTTLFLARQCNWAVPPQVSSAYEPKGGDSTSHTEKIHHMGFPDWTKPALLGAGCGAVVIAFIGFSQLGWKTSQGAADMAQEQADAAVVTALVPFCVAKAEQVSEQNMLARLRANNSAFSRSELVMKAGWATVGQSKTPDNALAIACANTLREAKSGA